MLHGLRWACAALPITMGVLTGLTVACHTRTPSAEPAPQVTPSNVEPTATVTAPPATVAPTPSAVPITAKPKLYLQPLGAELPLQDSQYVAKSLRAFYDLEVVELAAVPLPKDAYYAPRQRYRAEKLLDALEKIIPSDGHRILGLTGVDISTTKDGNPDWGILGLATVDGNVCVISAFRANRKAQSAEHARIRLGKTAVHEIGHTLGLEHCTIAGCLMHDGEGSVLTTDTEYDLCERCRQRVSLVNAERPIPWPRP